MVHILNCSTVHNIICGIESVIEHSLTSMLNMKEACKKINYSMYSAKSLTYLIICSRNYMVLEFLNSI